MQNLNIDSDKISALCEMHNVEKLYLFGSAIRNNFSDRSDIDFLVKFLSINAHKYFENYLSLKENLEKEFGRNVDLVEEQTVINPVLKCSIEQNRHLLFRI